MLVFKGTNPCAHEPTYNHFHISNGGHWTSPYDLFEKVDMGKGSPTRKNLFSRPDRNFLHGPSDFQKTIALAFSKATYPQIPYWVHLTSKAQNPIELIMISFGYKEWCASLCLIRRNALTCTLSGLISSNVYEYL